MKLKLKLKIIENYETYTGKNKFWLGIKDGDILELSQELSFIRHRNGGIYTPEIEVINKTNNTVIKDKGLKIRNIILRNFKYKEI